jgi:hypothetical protein
MALGEHRLDHLLLHLAREHDGDLTARVILPQVDERVLFCEVGECREDRARVPRRELDDRLQHRPREPRRVGGVRAGPDRGADLRVVEPAYERDATGSRGIRLDHGAAVE